MNGIWRISTVLRTAATKANLSNHLADRPALPHDPTVRQAPSRLVTWR
jgi:hypothetical protein